MKLIIGGAFQGKAEYASGLAGVSKEEMTDGSDCPLEALFHCRCMNHFHLWVRRAAAEGISTEGLAERLALQNPGIVLITNELGCGVVPVDREDRAYREQHGRICCQLAEKAGEVHRVICGIGTVIRHA